MAQLTPQELAGRKAGETPESNGFGQNERPLRPGGLYRLKDEDGNVVDELIVKTHPKFGDSQAAAVTRVGYKFVRPAEPGEVKEIEVDAKYLATENQGGGITADETLKGVLARLNAVEKENADLRAGRRAEEEKGAADGEVKAGAKDSAKSEAEARVEERQDAKTAQSETAPSDADLKPNKDEALSKTDANKNTNTNEKKEGK